VSDGGVKLYVVISPVREDYLKALNGKQDKELFKELFAFTHKNQIPVLNKMRDTSFKNDEFFDCDHLNKKGAQHMTRLISDFIKD